MEKVTNFICEYCGRLLIHDRCHGCGAGKSFSESKINVEDEQAIKYTFNADFASAGEHSFNSHAQRIFGSILNCHNSLTGAFIDDSKLVLNVGRIASYYLKLNKFWTRDTHGNMWLDTYPVYETSAVDDKSIVGTLTDRYERNIIGKFVLEITSLYL